MSVALLLKWPASSYTNLKSQSLQVVNDVQLTPLTTTARDNNITPADGMIIFNETTNSFQGYYSGNWNTIIGSTGTQTLITTVTGTLTSSNIDHLHDTPIQLLAGQGTGTVIEPIFVSLQYIPGDTPYTGGTGFHPLIYRGVNDGTNDVGDFSWNGVLQGTTGIYQCFSNQTTDSNAPPQDVSVIDNAGIYITDEGASPFPSAGNGTIKWIITYMIQQLG